MQEVAANVALSLDSQCTIAFGARAACRLNRGDLQGARDDYTVLRHLGVDVQQVYITLDVSQGMLLALLFLRL